MDKISTKKYMKSDKLSISILFKAVTLYNLR